MSEIRYDECSREFEFDGSWRDIYVLNSSIDDWKAVYQQLKQHRHEYFVAAEPAAPPAELERKFFDSNCKGTLKTYYRGLQINCHFFSEDEIEFDIDPREVNDQEGVDSVLEFMRLLGESTGKKVILTPENAENIVIISLDPKTNSFSYHSPSE